MVWSDLTSRKIASCENADAMNLRVRYYYVSQHPFIAKKTRTTVSTPSTKPPSAIELLLDLFSLSFILVIRLRSELL